MLTSCTSCHILFNGQDEGPLFERGSIGHGGLLYLRACT